jgi:hypothetical protein
MLCWQGVLTLFSSVSCQQHRSPSHLFTMTIFSLSCLIRTLRVRSNHAVLPRSPSTLVFLPSADLSNALWAASVVSLFLILSSALLCQICCCSSEMVRLPILFVKPMSSTFLQSQSQSLSVSTGCYWLLFYCDRFSPEHGKRLVSFFLPWLHAVNTSLYIRALMCDEMNSSTE